ncbi:MAG: MEDS domain-containing protein [Anaerolineae bacterium]|nr:MEDS domain-containing protein [Anaerolineae bacterium]
MEQNDFMVSLGFTDDKVPMGAHICQIYSDEDERTDALLKFLLQGLQTGERTACFSDDIDAQMLQDFFAPYNVSYNEYQQKQALTLAGTNAVYFQDNVFDPERMLSTLAHYHQESLDLGFPAARLIGEMAPKIQDVSGGNRLVEYESRVSLLLKERPVTTVCQYNANVFDGATIMDVLKVHPQMIVKGTVVYNPFYIPPEEFLKKI